MRNVKSIEEFRKRKEEKAKEQTVTVEITGDDATNFSAIIKANAEKAIKLSEQRLKRTKNLIKSMEHEKRNKD